MNKKKLILPSLFTILGLALAIKGYVMIADAKTNQFFLELLPTEIEYLDQYVDGSEANRLNTIYGTALLVIGSLFYVINALCLTAKISKPLPKKKVLKMFVLLVIISLGLASTVVGITTTVSATNSQTLLDNLEKTSDYYIDYYQLSEQFVSQHFVGIALLTLGIVLSVLSIIGYTKSLKKQKVAE